MLIWKDGLWLVLSIDSVLQQVPQKYRSWIILWSFYFHIQFAVVKSFVYIVHLSFSTCHIFFPLLRSQLCLSVSYSLMLWDFFGFVVVIGGLLYLFGFLGVLAAFLSGCRGSNMRRWRQQPGMVCSLKAMGFFSYSDTHFLAHWLQNSSSSSQLLLPRLKRETLTGIYCTFLITL